MITALAAATVVLSCAVAAHAQVAHWRNSVTFWTRASALAFDVSDYDAHMSLARILLDQRREAEARDQLRAAVGLRPGSADAHNRLGMVLASLGASAEAHPHLEAAVRLEPALENPRMNLATALVRLNRPAEAIHICGKSYA